MDELMAVLELGLRVLTAVIHNRDPDPGDVEMLRRQAPLSTADRPINEVACEVIQTALKRRAKTVRQE
jgi:hypothetical protein